MKFLTSLLVILLLGSPLLAADKKPYILYAMMVADTGVRLDDGSQWVMDKGDTFPVVMFKDQQSKIVLKLAGTSFITNTVNVKVIEGKDVTQEQLATYKTNVQHYIDGQTEKWKAALKTPAPAPAK